MNQTLQTTFLFLLCSGVASTALAGHSEGRAAMHATHPPAEILDHWDFDNWRVWELDQRGGDFYALTASGGTAMFRVRIPESTCQPSRTLEMISLTPGRTKVDRQGKIDHASVSIGDTDYAVSGSAEFRKGSFWVIMKFDLDTPERFFARIRDEEPVGVYVAQIAQSAEEKGWQVDTQGADDAFAFAFSHCRG